MLCVEEMKKRDVVLTPICAESILMYHRLKLSGVDVSMFFDRNPMMENMMYGDAMIRRSYHRENSIVIVCKSEYEGEIIDTLLGCGFSKEQIFGKNEVDLEISVYEASREVDLETFKRLLPAQMTVYTDGSDYLKLKKIRKIKELGGPYPGLTYEEFEGMWRKDNYFDQDGQPHIFIKRFELDVTSKCSLRCKHCGAMMQYFAHPKDLDCNDVISDYNRMLDLIEWTDDVLIMGGEPFVYNDLDKIIRGIKDNPKTENKVGMVKIVTNGTIVPNQKVIDELSGTDISVMISNYGKYSRKINELITSFQRFQVKYDVLDIGNWGYVQQLVDRDEPMTEEELTEKRKKCWKRHHAISEGRFYLCAFSNFSQKLCAVPYSEKNYVDLYDDDARMKIIDFLDPNHPLPESCSWCNGNFPENWEGDGKIPVAEQSNVVLPYRKFEGMKNV